MNISNQAQYNQVKAALESIGFNNVPGDAGIDWTKPVPARITVQLRREVISTSPVVTDLTP